MDFWEFIWGTLIVFFFVMFIIIFINCMIDIFRSHDLSGWAKALWLIFLIVLPLIGVLIYTIARGQGMAERGYKAQVEQAERIVAVGGGAPADQIASAKALLDSGAISQEDYERLKEKALS